MGVVSLDFGGSSVKYALAGRDGTLRDTGRCPAPLESSAAFAECVEAIVRQFEDVQGVAVSLPGYVDAETGVLAGSGAYRALYGCNIVALLQARLGLPVAVENDGKCGALAEAAFGALRGCRDGVVLILGSGIAGGIIKNGSVHAGRDFAAGEFSNYLVDPDCPSFLGLAVMHCAAFGLTYRLCKAKHLALDCQDLAQELLGVDAAFGGRFPAQPGAPQRIRADGRQLARWLAEEDAAAKQVYSEFLRDLAFMAANIQITFAPEKIVIGGGLSRIPGMIEALRRTLDGYYEGVGFGPKLRAEIVPSAYLDECNLVGAASNFYTRNPKNLREDSL